jgi:hypothetical protein
MMVLPLGVLGFFWGWSERRDLERWSAQSSDKLQKGVNHYYFRQAHKAIVCGVLFGFFTHAVGLFRWRTSDSVENIVANISAFTGFLVLGAFVGMIVGAITRRNLVRRLSAT